MQLETLLSAAHTVPLLFDHAPAALEAARAEHSRWTCEAVSALRAADLPVPTRPDVLQAEPALCAAIAADVLLRGRWSLTFDREFRPLGGLRRSATVLLQRNRYLFRSSSKI